MPCSDSGYSNSQYDIMEKRLDAATDYLCRTLTHMERSALVSTEWLLKNPDIAVWWKEHKAADVARRIREEKEAREKEAKRAARAKLTPDERALLGIK